MYEKFKNLKFRNPELTKKEKDPEITKKEEDPGLTKNENTKDPHGAARFENLDHYDLDQMEKEVSKFNKEMCIQFVGGLIAGVYYTATAKPLVGAPADNKFVQGNRQEFCDKLAKASEHPDVQKSEWASDAYKVMQGQNNAQEGQGQAMPQNTIDVFVDQVYGHAELDAKARAEGKECASENEHRDFDIECHKKLQTKFIEAGYPSGFMLHVIAEQKEKWSKQGTFEFPPTYSTEDPLFFNEDKSHKNKPEENQGRSRGQDPSSSDSDSDSDEEIKRKIQEYQGESDGEEIIEELEKELEERENRRQESGRNSLNVSQNNNSLFSSQNKDKTDSESDEEDKDTFSKGYFNESSPV